MANFVLHVPSRLRSFTVSSSSNGAPPTASGSSVGGGGPVILELPLEKIKRPLMRTRANDPIKVKELMDSISEIGLQVPIDVLEVEGTYYGMCFSGLFEKFLRVSPVRGSPTAWTPDHPMQSSSRYKRDSQASSALASNRSAPNVKDIKF
ncbi:Sulfiredoxin, chloroplastic/mitochondrial [Senna tora]|uniref:sulfiredoxin n=1 Tax=Senna tora TaxID=362788 RepID=A0A835CIJ8_9FABA|nr:Sulfiredoxin, chloroplastic/mitochondrial [Senna tora]